MLKLRSARGKINRLTAVLLALIGVMLVLIAVPGWQRFRYRSEKTACEQALKSAQDGLIIEYLSHFESGTVQQAMETLDDVMPERANLCPAGGTVYLVRGSNGIFQPVCGLHDSDLPRRTRLNASRALELLDAALRKAQRDGEAEPATVEISLNGMPLSCVRVQTEEPLRWGTRMTEDYEGTVCFFGVSGAGSFAGQPVAEGEICYLVYADADYCAIWHPENDWTGSAYSG